MDCVFGIVSEKNHHHHQLDFLLRCLIGISWFYVLHLGLCFILSKFFAKGIKSMIDLLFLHVDIQLWPHYILKRLSLLHCVAFAPLSKIF